MARRIAYLHIGLAGSGGGFLEEALAAHADRLAQMDVRFPAAAPDEMFKAAIEVRRDHRAWGHRRRDVEGTWAEVCRRIQKSRGTFVLSQELLAACTAEQADLLLDTLGGVEVHVVVTARRADAERHELADLTARWAAAVGSADRVHVLVVPVDAEPAAWIWRAFGELVGFDAAQLPLPTDAGLPPYLVRSLAYAVGRDADAPTETPTTSTDQLWWTTALLSAALVEVAELRASEQALAERNAKLEKKRRKLKRRLAEID